jgi:aconitate hydratase
LVLSVTEQLRAHGVVGKFVEFFGEGLDVLTLADRATIANMAPEYGATMGFFPIDGVTLDYLRLTGRTEEQIDLVERYCKSQGLWRQKDLFPDFTESLSLNLNEVEPALAGPKRPQDRINLSQMQGAFRQAFTAPVGPQGFGRKAEDFEKKVHTEIGGGEEIGNGSVVIAAITSCTNTSNPGVMVAAGLLAKKCRARGLGVKPWVKTSLAPGSKVVTDYLDRSGLTPYLEQLGFHTVGYGCTTCIGNSGPLPEAIVDAVVSSDLVVASVLSGNRNFEGRINPHTRANYLTSPPLVVAYAVAGSVDIDLEKEPLGYDSESRPVFLREVWPSNAEVARVIEESVVPEAFLESYGNVYTGNETWNSVKSSNEAIYMWDENSTYIQEPPFFMNMTIEEDEIRGISGARCLLKLGDSVTTDHISPAGAIALDSPAGRYLENKKVSLRDFNSYGSRRGNDQVMKRGTFANVRVRNQLAPGTEGGLTTDFTTGEVTSVYEAALNYKREDIPLIVLAGRDYGMGSSRDWAAKGTLLLGVKAVVAETYERIHRSNLVFMGVLPLQFLPGKNSESYGLTGNERFHIPVDESLYPGQEILMSVQGEQGAPDQEIPVIVRIDSPVEVDYYRNGGILQTVLRKMLVS